MRVGMQRQLTITIAEDVYEDLHQSMDKTEISGFIEVLVRPHVSSVANLEHSVVDLLAMPDSCDTSFEPPRLGAKLYRKSDAV